MTIFDITVDHASLYFKELWDIYHTNKINLLVVNYTKYISLWKV